MLIVADIHFGKAAAFRAQGVPVPRGTTTQNLNALDELINACEAQHVLFLGDFLHARASHASATLDALHGWRARHKLIRLTLVRGNHDAHARGYVVAGHLHPVYRLTTAGDSVRLPCFVFGAAGSVLPSFGAFTGGFAITPQQGERVFVATEDAVFEVPDNPAIFNSGF